MAVNGSGATCAHGRKPSGHVRPIQSGVIAKTQHKNHMREVLGQLQARTRHGARSVMPTNHFSTRPLYLQLRDALAERVAGGEWRPGAAIPNEGDLAREFGVSAGTMRKALD